MNLKQGGGCKMSVVFRLVHLSDLHFSHGSLKSSLHAHSIEHLMGISSIVKKIDYDLLIVSGDLSNRGDTESLNQAKSWLQYNFLTDNDQITGLACPVEKLIVIPGNHDAYNHPKSGGPIVLARQNSLRNYNHIFQDHCYSPDHDCRYYWRTKGNAGIFIVAVDSSYLGDPDTEAEGIPDIKDCAISAISKPARGKISRQQTERIIRWFDLGMRGELITESGSDQYIDKTMFSKSFKILVMHHYIFEPHGHAFSFSLSLDHRKTVMRNFALADFDLVLCGHKHIPDFLPESYGHFFEDRRSKGRYVLNLFRRLIRINSMPEQFVDRDGKKIGKWLSKIISFVLKRTPKMQDESDDNYTMRLIDALREILSTPENWKKALRDFLLDPSREEGGPITIPEAMEIVSQMTSALTKSERKLLSDEAKKIIPALNGLTSRPVVQGMCGSSAKACNVTRKTRAFSVYDLNIDNGKCEVTRLDYEWLESGSDFKPSVSNYHKFEADRRVPF